MTVPLSDQEIEALEKLALGVPRHVVNNGFVLAQHPVAGEWFLYSDNGRGTGRQYIASFPAGKHYFGTLAQFMESAHPKAILALIGTLRKLRRQRDEARKALEPFARMVPSSFYNDGDNEGYGIMLHAMPNKSPDFRRRDILAARAALTKTPSDARS